MITEQRKREIEESIRNRQKNERALYVDYDGKILYDSEKQGEATHERTFVTEEDNRKYAPLSSVAIHSHPVRKKWGSYWASSFSDWDIYMAMKFNFPEIRFADRYYTGILIRKGKTWKNYWGKYWTDGVREKIYKEIYEDNVRKYRDLMLNGKITLKYYIQNYGDLLVKDFAKKYNLDYRRELRHPVPPVDLRKTVPKKYLKKYPKLVLQ